MWRQWDARRFYKEREGRSEGGTLKGGVRSRQLMDEMVEESDRKKKTLQNPRIKKNIK